MTPVYRGAVAAREPKYLALGVLVDATIQEKMHGFPGWCEIPPAMRGHMAMLRDDGLAEEWQVRKGWWRATAKAINAHRRVSDQPQITI